MASYFSVSFFACILPIAVVAYGVLPRRVRWVWLLVASYVFLAWLSGRLVAFTVLSTATVYVLARCVDAVYRSRDEQAKKVKGKQRRAVRTAYRNRARWLLALGALINFGILVALKYLGFFSSSLSSLGGAFGVELPVVSLNIGAPMGISFYTLMAVSYLADVYRESVPADRHLGRVALYLVFFPQIMEGPLARYDQTAHALMEGRPLTRDNLYAGTLRIFFGFAKKLVVADRLDKLVGAAFDSYATLDGGVIAVAAVLYTFQLYCDFSGTMDVALGMARMFGVELPENFRQPFFSKTASEFWQRWHITLGMWFKDYVFYPVSFSKLCKSWSGKARKRFGRQVGPLLVSSIALFCVWLGNGLWHGAGTQYLLFGMYYFVLIVCGGFVDIYAQRWAADRGVERDAGVYGALRVARTLALVFLGELIFRSASAPDAFAMIGKVFGSFSLAGIASGGLLSLGLDAADLALVAVCAVALVAFDAVAERGTSPLASVATKGAAVRWACWIALLAFVVVFGAYGYGYVPVDPMYAQF